MGFWQLGEGDPWVVAWITQGSTCPKAQGLPMRVWPMDLRPTAPDSQLSPPQLPPAPPRPRGPPRFAVPGSSRPCLGPRGTDPNIAPNLSKEELPRPLPARLGVGGTVRVGGEPLHTPPGEATKDVEPLPRSFQDGDGKEGGSRGRMGGKERVQEAAGRGRRPGVGG